MVRCVCTSDAVATFSILFSQIKLFFWYKLPSQCHYLVDIRKSLDIVHTQGEWIKKALNTRKQESLGIILEAIYHR